MADHVPLLCFILILIHVTLTSGEDITGVIRATTHPVKLFTEETKETSDKYFASLTTDSTKERKNNKSLLITGDDKNDQHFPNQKRLSQLGKQLTTYLHPVIVVVGLTGNVLSLLVMLQRDNRRLSSCNYMAALAVSDSGLLISVAQYWIRTDVYRSPIGQLECGILVYSGMVSSGIGVFVIIAMTADRFLAITFPLKVVVWSSPRKARIITALLLVTMTIYNIPYILFSKAVANGTQCYPLVGNHLFITVFSLFDICLKSVLPFITLLILNALIIKAIRQRMDVFGKRGDSEGDGGQSSKLSHEQKSRDRQLTIMLLLVSFALLTLTLPQFLRLAIFSFSDHRNNPAKFGIFVLVSNITNKFFFANNAINFFLYAMSGSKFRQDLAQIICCKTTKNMASSNSSQQSQISHTNTNTRY